MASLFPATIPIPLWMLAILLIIGVLITLYAIFITFFSMQIPFVWAQLKAQIKKKALVMMHYSNNRIKIFCPDRSGKDKHENTLSLSLELGAKFDPSGTGYSELLDKSSVYNYYTKATTAIKAKYAKAVDDFYTFCNSKGITVNRSLIDALVIHNLDIDDVYEQPLHDYVTNNLPLPIRTPQEEWLNEDLLESKESELNLHLLALENTDTSNFSKSDLKQYEEDMVATKTNIEFIRGKFADLDRLQELKQDVKQTDYDIATLVAHNKKSMEEIDIITGYLDPDTRETKYTLKKLQQELKDLVISDGLFVFQSVHDFIFAASSLNSAGMMEAINIARSDALEQNRVDQNGWTMQNIGMLVIILVILFAGIGITYKIMFGE